MVLIECVGKAEAEGGSELEPTKSEPNAVHGSRCPEVNDGEKMGKKAISPLDSADGHGDGSGDDGPVIGAKESRVRV